jgi:CBS-domain-containing membrane protein
MLKHHVSGLPVIDNHGKVVGILSEGDLLRRGEIQTEHKRSAWLDGAEHSSHADTPGSASTGSHRT